MTVIVLRSVLVVKSNTTIHQCQTNEIMEMSNFVGLKFIKTIQWATIQQSKKALCHLMMTDSNVCDDHLTITTSTKIHHIWHRKCVWIVDIKSEILQGICHNELWQKSCKCTVNVAFFFSHRIKILLCDLFIAFETQT